MKNNYKQYYDSFSSLRNNNYLKVYNAQFGKYLNSGAKVLELGCGEGHFINYLHLEKGIKNITGVETNKNFISSLRKLYSHSDIKIINEDAKNFLKKCEEKYDVIVMIDLLEHIDKKDVEDFLKLIRLRLNNNGTVVIRTPNAESPFFGSFYRYIDFTHRFSYTRHSLTYLMSKCGYKKIKIKKAHLYSSIYTLPIILMRLIIEFVYKITSFLYLGPDGLNSIVTPNLIVIAKK